MPSVLGARDPPFSVTGAGVKGHADVDTCPSSCCASGKSVCNSSYSDRASYGIRIIWYISAMLSFTKNNCRKSTFPMEELVSEACPPPEYPVLLALLAAAVAFAVSMDLSSVAYKVARTENEDCTPSRRCEMTAAMLEWGSENTASAAKGGTAMVE